MSDLFKWSLPQIRIAGPNSRLVRERHLCKGSWFYYFLNGEWEELPELIDVHVYAIRMKAMDWIVTPPVTCLDENSPVYEAIRKRSNSDRRECQYGPEYSMRVEGYEQALLFFGNKSSRSLRSLIRVGGSYTLATSLQEQDGYAWYIPSVIERSTQ